MTRSMKVIQTIWIPVLLVSLASEPGASAQRKFPKFSPPDIGYVTSITYPTEGASGMVGLLVNLDSSAHVKDVQTLRDIPSVTGSSLVAVNNWTYTPAKFNGKPGAANLPVNIIFNPWDAHPQSIPLPPVETQIPPGGAVGFAPPTVLAASFAAYPQHGNPSGTLVLDVTVNKAGRAVRVSVVRSRVASLTKPVVTAVKKWRFKPGSLDGIPITSKMVVAFVFRPPPITSH
jgi:TonB family protein